MWTKFRHKIVFAILHPIFTVYLGLRYGYRAKKYKLPKGPCLILFNHPTNFDPFMVALSFKGPIYYIANDDIFNIPIISPIISALVAPIPKSKSVRDIQAVKDSIKVIKEGGRVGVAPEGNRTYSGRLAHVDFAIVKLVRLLKVPMVLYNIKGGYGVNPRFSKNIRRGKSFGEVNKVLSYQEISKLTDEELYQEIVKSLDYNDLDLNQTYKGKALAESLESLFYVCPVCGGISTLKSHKNHVSCSKCSLDVEYTDKLTLKSDNKVFKFKTIYDWYLYQEDFMRKMNVKENIEIFSDDNVTLQKVVKKKRRNIEMVGRLSIYNDRLIIENSESKKEFLFKDLVSLAIAYHNTIFINLDKESYQLKSSVEFNGLKYVHLYYHVKNMKQGVTNEFLGV